MPSFPAQAMRHAFVVLLLTTGTPHLAASPVAGAARPVADVCPAFASACGLPQPPARERTPSMRTCRVDRIIDGDTFMCGADRIRLLLIDAPERGQAPFGARATESLARLLPVGSSARLEFDVQRTDRFGRTLAYVFAPDSTFVNEAMVRAGFAVPLVVPPNVRHVDRIRSAAREARAARAGLWAVDGFRCRPADARAGRC
jgi:micrococcal nuclease